MGDCISPAAISDIATKDTQRLVGSVAKTLAGNTVFINVLDGGTFPSGISDEVRSSVQLPAAPGDSLAIPTFVNDLDLCGTVGLQDKTDTVEFLYSLQSKRGFGPRVCVKKGYAAFKSSYLAAEDSLAKLISQYINADIRAQLYLKSASKFVAKTGVCFESLFTGGNFSDVNIKFANVLPDSPMTFKALHYLATYLREVLWAEPFPASGKVQPHFRFIAGSDQIEALRAEAGVEKVMIALTEGGYQLGEKALTAYSFESAPAYRGLAFGVDQTPLRASGFNADGTLNLINPRINVVDAVKNKAYSKPNPAWLAAEYEVGFLIAPGTFKRLVPEKYVGEGSFKFAPQLHMGELLWHYLQDNDCNVWGDYGWHKYQITRAYEPVRPHHIIPVLYKRCKPDFGFAACTVTSCNSL